ncbi:MAG TPA: lipase, partial [Intrasporangium sp.]|nr:lipase [Intrasporangium sp.]
MAAPVRSAQTSQHERIPTVGSSEQPGLLASLGLAAKALLTPTGLAGAALEATWLGLHLGLYPLGLMGARASHQRRGYRVDHLPPTQRGLAVRDVEAAETPILLVHGMVDNRS